LVGISCGQVITGQISFADGTTKTIGATEVHEGATRLFFQWIFPRRR
jgi:hypothetical protein